MKWYSWLGVILVIGVLVWVLMGVFWLRETPHPVSFVVTGDSFIVVWDDGTGPHQTKAQTSKWEYQSEATPGTYVSVSAWGFGSEALICNIYIDDELQGARIVDGAHVNGIGLSSGVNPTVMCDAMVP